MGDVVTGRFITKSDIPADKVINGAPEWGLEGVVIVGFREDGDFYFASSYGDSGDILYLFERAKHELMKMEDQMMENGFPEKGA